MRILIVEDTVENREKMSDRLTMNGHEVTAPETLELLKIAIEDEDYEIVLLDQDLNNFPDFQDEGSLRGDQIGKAIFHRLNAENFGAYIIPTNMDAGFSQNLEMYGNEKFKVLKAIDKSTISLAVSQIETRISDIKNS